MKSNSQAYFEKVCARRMQAYLAMETSPDEDQEQAKHLAQLMAVLPVLCRLGNFRLAEDTTCVCSISLKPGIASDQQKCKEALLPKSTNYR